MKPIDPFNRNHRRRQGFSLVELLVVVGIIAIIAGVTFSAAGNIGKSGNMESTINSISASLNVARSIALRDGKEAAVIFSSGFGESLSELRIVVKNPNHYVGATAGHRSNWGYSDFDDRPPESLGRNIKVAGPDFEGSTGWFSPAVRQNDVADKRWAADSAIATYKWLGVCFGPDGAIKTKTDDDGTYSFFYDRDGDTDFTYGTGAGANSGEITIQWLPFLAIYDNRDFQKYDPTMTALSAWLQTTSTETDAVTGKPRILSFNRYSGLLQKK